MKRSFDRKYMIFDLKSMVCSDVWKEIKTIFQRQMATVKQRIDQPNIVNKTVIYMFYLKWLMIDYLNGLKT